MSPFTKHAHDIAFAVFRVAKLVENRKLCSELENSAIELILRYEEVGNPALADSATVVDILERLISLGESIKEIGPTNAKILKRELADFQTAIREQAANHTNGRLEADLNDIFVSNGRYSVSGSSELQTKNHKPSTITNELTERQSAILNVVKETPSCRLRNLMERFSNISERTIRNEIQILINSNLIKRIGGGGPNSYFEFLRPSGNSGNLGPSPDLSGVIEATAV